MKGQGKAALAASLLMTLGLALCAQNQELGGRSIPVTDPLSGNNAKNATYEGVRNIKLNEDRDQRWFVTKVYELKYIRANDITPWVFGAVQRYNSGSIVNRLNYPAGNKQLIVVTTGKDMMPYVDDIVAALDRPCAKKNTYNSIVDGAGQTYATYRPLYRGSNDIIQDVLRDARGWGWGWFDDANGVYYWKDNRSHTELVGKWLKALDRPVPQVEISLNVYEVADSDFRELGFDFAQWKNGPGNSLFGIGYDFSKYKSSEQAVDQVLGSSSGFLFAPQFDASFLKMLQEKGKARTSSSSKLTLVNDPSNTSTTKYSLSFTPSYQNITKDDNRLLAVQQNTKTSYSFYVLSPLIGMAEDGDKAGNIKATYNLTVSEHVDTVNASGNDASLAYNYHTFKTSTRIAAGSEKLIASYAKDHKVKVDIGLPYLKDIPGIKYLVGETAESVLHTTVFVTVRVEPIVNQNETVRWAGKMIDEATLSETYMKN